jgi:geranylgeranyl diphosphate synthase type I
VTEPRFAEVAAVVRQAIEQASDEPSFRDLLVRLMARRGRVLAPDGRAKWPAFVLETSRALGGDEASAVLAAAAVELAVAAADVADDLVDDEWDADVADRGRALNASFGLLLLAQRCALRLQHPLGSATALSIVQTLVDGAVTACGGQDLDLVLEGRVDVDEEQAHQMTSRKSGSIVGLACRIGAAVASSDPIVLEAAREFGVHVGTIAQLLNDLAGVDPERVAAGTDVRRRKKTLPVAFGLRCAREEGLADVLEWYRRPERTDAASERDLAKRLNELGAMDFTWIVADAHRREALGTLDRLARATGRKSVWRLRRLIPNLGERMVQSAA